HMTVANSFALRISGIDNNTPDPAGGKIVRKGSGNEPTGLLLETAARLLSIKQEPLSREQQLQLIQDQQLFYASHGITTAQDGHTSFESLKLLTAAAQQKKLFIDIEALPSYHTLDSVLADPGYQFG